jgi:hypothetical protein
VRSLPFTGFGSPEGSLFLAGRSITLVLVTRPDGHMAAIWYGYYSSIKSGFEGLYSP